MRTPNGSTARTTVPGLTITTLPPQPLPHRASIDRAKLSVDRIDHFLRGLGGIRDGAGIGKPPRGGNGRQIIEQRPNRLRDDGGADFGDQSGQPRGHYRLAKIFCTVAATLGSLPAIFASSFFAASSTSRSTARATASVTSLSPASWTRGVLWLVSLRSCFWRKGVA